MTIANIRPYVAHRVSILLVGVVFPLSALAQQTAPTTPAPAERDLAVIVDYRHESAAEFRPYSHWRWSPERKAAAGDFSRRAIVAAEDGGRHLLLRVSPEFPWDGQPVALHTLTSDYFPPESDAVVLRLRVESGAFILAVGGPTAYFGDSDVFTASRRVEAGGWTDVRFDLHEGLQRNHRRAGYGAAAQVVAYTRWAQESTTVYVLPGSSGTLLVQSAKLVGGVRGRPFPTFSPAAMEVVQHVPATLENAFSILLADSQTADFKASWLEPGACRYPPPVLAIVEGASPESVAVSATAGWSEEIRWAGLKTVPAAGSDALALKVRVATDTPSTQLTADAGQPIDIGILVAPAGGPFPWSRLAPPAEWRREARAKGYDLNLSHRVVGAMADLDVALFHARRFVRLDVWESLVIPFEDFACVAATGAFRPRLAAHGPLAASDASAAVLWLVPWPRRKPGSPATATVADIRFVHLSSSGHTPRRSYPAPRPLAKQQEKQP